MKMPTDFTKGEIKVLQLVGWVTYLGLMLAWLIWLFLPPTRPSTDGLILTLGFMYICKEMTKGRS